MSARTRAPAGPSCVPRGCMTHLRLDSEPTHPIAGDTWSWRKSHPDFPASAGWTLSYSLRGPINLIWDVSWVSVDGDTWIITIPASATALLPAGRYRVAAHFAGGGAHASERYTEALPALQVLANLATVAPGDAISHAERMIPLLEQAIESLASTNIKFYQVGQRMVTKHDLPELRRQLGFYRAELRRQRSPDQLVRRLPARFMRPQ